MLNFKRFLGLAGFAGYFIFGGGLTAPLGATTMVELSLGNQARDARWIGRVHVENVRAIETSGFPFSVAEGRVIEVMKGAGKVGDKVSFQLPGGKRGSHTVAVMGMGAVRADADYVLFLDAAPDAAQSSLNGSAAGVVGWTLYKIVKAGAQQEVVMRQGESTIARKSVAGYALSHDSRVVGTYSSFLDSLYREME